MKASILTFAFLILLCGCLGKERRGDSPMGGGGGTPGGSGDGPRNGQERRQRPETVSNRPVNKASQNPFFSPFSNGLGGNPAELFDQDLNSSLLSPEEQIGSISNHDVPDSGGRAIANVTPDAEGLNKSGEGGNPSFSYAVRGYKEGNATPTPQCQGTLTSKRDGTCIVTTAAHCLTDAEDINNPTPPPVVAHGVRQHDKKSRKMVTFTAPDFGTVEALAILNPTYVSQSNIRNVTKSATGVTVHGTPASHDIALLAFKGEACEKTGAMVVPLSTSCPSKDMQIGSRWKRTSFLARAQQFFEDSMKVLINGTGIKQGDSGGGLFCREEGKPTRTMGVLSTGGASENKNQWGFWNEATYSARESTGWAMGMEQSIFSGSGPSIASGDSGNSASRKPSRELAAR